MIKATLTAASALAILIAASSFAGAESLNHLVTPESIAAFCADKPVGSELTATITMPDNTTLTGKIECEAEHVAGTSDSSNAISMPGGDDDGGISDDGEDDNGGLGSGSDDSNDDSNDDNSGSGDSHDGGNDDGGDD